LQKLHAKIEKVAKSCNIKFLETAQNIELYISWVFRKLLEAVKKSCKSCKNLPYWSVILPLCFHFFSVPLTIGYFFGWWLFVVFLLSSWVTWNNKSINNWILCDNWFLVLKPLWRYSVRWRRQPSMIWSFWWQTLLSEYMAAKTCE